MLLLLIRHAQAGDRDPARWPDDSLRPLTDEGAKIQLEVAGALKRLKLEPELVLSSPWTRAMQTAEITARTLKLGHPVACPPLAEAPDLDALQEHVGTRGPDSVVALVGHSPWMEELAALLLTGEDDGLELDYPKSGVMGIETERLAAGMGTLRWFWRAGQVRKLGK